MIATAVKSYIASFDGDNMKFIERNAKGDVSIHTNTFKNKGLHRAWLALPGELFIKRFHIKPFESKRSLRKILPTSLENMLFKSQSEQKMMHTLSTTSLEEHKFTSYSLPEEISKEFSQKCAEKITSITSAVPLPFGLAYFIPKGEDAIVLCKSEGQKITAALINKEGQVVDYRILSKKNFEEQAQLTLQNWCNFYKTATIYMSPKLDTPRYISADIKSRLQKITNAPKGFTDEDLALYGLLSISEQAWRHPASFSIEDKSLQKSLQKMSARFIYIWALFFIATVLAGGYFAYTQQKFMREQKEIEASIESTFNEAMPGVPLVDAPLQMTRRVNELALLAGNGLIHISPLDGQLVHLQVLLNEANISVILDELNINKNSFKIKGQLASLSQVDKLQSIVKQAFDGYVVELKSAQMRDDSKVDFYVEATK